MKKQQTSRPFMKFFILFLLTYVIANIYVFYRVWVAMPPSTIGYSILVTIGLLVTISPIIVFTIGEQLPVGLTTLLYKIGTAWLCIFIYFFIFILIKDIIAISHLLPKEAVTKYTHDNWAVFSLMVGFVTMLMICGYLKYQSKDRIEIPIVVEKSLGSKDSIKIVAISDLHLGYSIGSDELLDWIELINKENPDAVIIAGDIIDSSPRPLKEGNFAQYFKGIKAPIYASLGNHEYISGIETSIQFIKDAGIHLLRDSSVLIDDSYYILGRDDYSNFRRKPLADLVENLDKSKPIIMLDHQPHKLNEAEKNGIDVQFSGHTHHGQIWPISIITDRMYENSHGYLKKGNTNVYVSSGIGIWGGKFRIGTQSEYAVITIRTK